MDVRQVLKRPVARSAASPLRSRTQGPVRFPPFEDVSTQVMQEIATYQISPFGQIQLCSEHIPYNSAKKNFYAKTGRESIEAFKYEFRVPGQQAAYKIMWDYNIGLVRMTPFFKSLGYPKPSQMLDKNPGLREISPSITGGSVSAQGYWMPYRCARAVCATFCHDIAGALIPLFGPEFPMECTPPDSQFFGDMVISQQLVVEATMEAEASRDAYELRKDAALNGSLGQRRLDVDAPQRHTRHGDAHSWFRFSPRPLARAAPRITGCNPPPGPGSSLRGEANPETRHFRYGSGTSLPPINPPKRDSTYRTQVSDPPKRVLTGAETAPAPWVVKRRRADQECSNDGYDPKRATTAARASFDVAQQHIHDRNDDGHRGRSARSAREDYAAAAVLVGLQTDGVGAAADPVWDGHGGTPPRHG
ncbi:hypothetical protein G6O67_000821 [Ophiocordyceps sinensis]|nr:hypothetical protein G6O67_000821 [Ophiocordyceps sinensis]